MRFLAKNHRCHRYSAFFRWHASRCETCRVAARPDPPVVISFPKPAASFRPATVTLRKVTVRGRKVTVRGRKVTVRGRKVTVRGRKVTVRGRKVTVRGRKVTVTFPPATTGFATFFIQNRLFCSISRFSPVFKVARLALRGVSGRSAPRPTGERLAPRAARHPTK